MEKDKTKKTFKLKQAVIRMVAGTAVRSAEPLSSPDAALRAVAKELAQYDREVMCVINLRNDLTPINFNIVSVGCLNESITHPRELIKSVVLSNAAAIMMLHTHPSGRLVPSKDDVQTTDRMMKVCELVGVRLLDHIIVGPDATSFFSMHDKRELPCHAEYLYERDLDSLNWHVPVVAEGYNPY